MDIPQKILYDTCHHSEVQIKVHLFNFVRQMQCLLYHCSHVLIFINKMTHHSMPTQSANNIRMFEFQCEMKIDIFHDIGGNKYLHVNLR